MTATQRYAQMEQQLLMGRADGTLTGEAETALLEEMDEAWDVLDERERALASARAACLSAESPPTVPCAAERA